MNHPILLVPIALVAVSLPVQAALIAVDGGYVATAGTDPSYVDTGGTELTDGDVGGDVWPSPTLDFEPLVGWFNLEATATFSFSSPVGIERIVVWGADSDNSAGVNLAPTIRVTANGFDQTFTTTNPAGSGTTVPIEMSGLGLNVDEVTLTFATAGQWSMISEVQFFDVVPEPSTGLLGAIGATSLLMRRRRVL